jgi:DNA topoisomerase III
VISDNLTRMCKCNEEGILQTVVKESTNKGRKFWSCRKAEHARCAFFEWDDEPPRTASTQGAMISRAESLNTCNSKGSGATSGGCFNVRTLVFIIVCTYLWMHFSVAKKATGPMVSRSSLVLSERDVLMFLFETLECPNEGNNSNKRTKGFGSSTNDNIIATCYKCQQPGHFSSC